MNGFDMRPQHLREDQLKRAILSHGSTEYVDWWADRVLQPPLRIENGLAIPSDRPGNGLAWDADAVAKYRLD